MKRLVEILLILALLVTVVQMARADGYQPNSFTTTGQGVTINNINSAVSYHKLTWTKSGTVTVCSVRIDSSVDGISWNVGDVLAAQDCSVNGTATSSAIQVNYTRVNVTSFTGTGSVAIPYNLYVNSPAGGGGTTINTTNNVLPKRSNATTFVDSAFTDNGSTVSSSLPLSISGNGTLDLNTWACTALSGAGQVRYCAFTGDIAVISEGTSLRTVLKLSGAGTNGISGGIPYFASAGSILTSSAALASGSVVFGGGAGAAPNTSTTVAAYQTLANNTNAAAVPSFVATGLLIKNATGNATTYSNGSYVDFCNTITVPSGTLAVGDHFDWGWDGVITAGSGTPLAFRAGVQLGGNTASVSAGSTPTVNLIYPFHFVAHAFVVSATTIQYDILWEDLPNLGIKSQGMDNGTFGISTLTVSDVTANSLVLHTGGYFNGAQSGSETAACKGAWVHIYKGNF